MHNVLRNRKVKIAAIVALLILISMICVSQFFYAFDIALCCGDDEAMAVVAKNLAFGNGYALSAHYSGEAGFFPFDPGITTGPTLIVPASILIRVFGNLAWVPGMATLLEICLLSIWIGCLISRYESVLRGVIFIAVLLVIAHSLVGSYAWVGLLGEIPAALLCVVAIVVWSRDPDNLHRLTFSSLIFGFAALTKLLATLCYAPLGIWLAYQFLYKRDKRSIVKRMAASLAVFVAPLAAFEVIKLVSIGPAEYLGVLKELISFFGRTAVPGQAIGILAKIQINSQNFFANFGILPVILLFIEAGGVVLMLASSRVDNEVKRRYFLFVAAAYVNWIWFFTLSIGWPRYITIGLLLDAAAIATLVSTFYGGRWAALAALALVVHLPTPLVSLHRALYAFVGIGTASNRLHHLEDAAAVLMDIPKESVLVGGWWPSISGLEYILPSGNNFVQFDHIKADRVGAPMILVRNTGWTSGQYENPAFSLWESLCSDVIFDQPPYKVSRCPFDAADSSKNLQTAARNVLSVSAPAPRLRAVAGGWDLFAHAPASLQLPVEQGATELVIGFGMDQASWQSSEPYPTDGVCFVVDAIASDGTNSEMFRRCLSPYEKVEDRGEKREAVKLPKLSVQLILKTETRDSSYWDWSYWSKLEFREADQPDVR